MREKLGLTLNDFEHLGIKKGTLSNYELGKTEPKFNTLLDLSNFFRLTLDELLTVDLTQKESSDITKYTLKSEDAHSSLNIGDSNLTPQESHSYIRMVREAEEMYNPKNEDSLLYKMYREKDTEVKELSEKIGEQRNEIETLRKENERLKEEIENFIKETTLTERYTQNLSDAEFVQVAAAKVK